jgi:hypothetical protein
MTESGVKRKRTRLRVAHLVANDLGSTRAGVGHFSYANGPSHHIFEIWRVGNLGGGP